jgi:hypothetical protein
MQYYTLEVYSGRNDDHGRAVAAAHEQYRQRLRDLHGVLPDHVIALADLQGVGDGLLVRVDHRRDCRTLILTLRCGHLQMGYYDLVLEYSDASITTEHDQILAWIARTTKGCWRHECDIAYHEVDLADDGLIEHRLLFHYGLWFAVTCRSLAWETLPRSQREFARCRDRYPGGPSTAGLHFDDATCRLELRSDASSR